MIAQHLRAWVDYSEAAATLSFWRTRAGSEVDFGDERLQMDGILCLPVPELLNGIVPGTPPP